MTNLEIGRLFRDIAAAYSIKDEKKFYFQMIAYQRAADSIEGSTAEVADLWKESKLGDLAGIGPTIISRIDELLKTGKVKHFEEIKKDIPPAFFPLLTIPKIGPKSAYKLVTILKLENPKSVVEDLEKKAKSGEIAKIEGFGAKSQDLILQSIAEFKMGKTKSSRMVLPFAFEIAQKVLNYLKECKAVQKAETLGSLRRMVATIGDIDIAVASDQPKEVIEWFTKYPYKERIIEAGPSTASILTSGGKQVDLMVQPAFGFGALLAHFTGSKAHNIHLRTFAQSKGMSLSERGIKTLKKVPPFAPPSGATGGKQNYDAKLKLYQFPTEEEFYEAIGLQWIPPEIREDNGEIELAIKNQLPKLVELNDIKGDLHTHSSFNIEPSHDLGVDSIEGMAKKAKALGYEYFGLAEHNPSVTKHSSNEIYGIIKRRNCEIEQTLKSIKSVQILKLLEVDILADGNLAIDDKAANLLDGMIVSIHSSFSQDEASMTKRIIKGLSHPKARIFAHPTGRFLGSREGYKVRWEEIFSFCQKNNKALEINAWPTRLDLPDNLIFEAVKKEIMLVIDTDSHAKDHMDMMKFGVWQARRGWAKKENILNTMPFEKLKRWLLNDK